MDDIQVGMTNNWFYVSALVAAVTLAFVITKRKNMTKQIANLGMFISPVLALPTGIWWFIARIEIGNDPTTYHSRTFCDYSMLSVMVLAVVFMLCALRLDRIERLKRAARPPNKRRTLSSNC